MAGARPARPPNTGWRSPGSTTEHWLALAGSRTLADLARLDHRTLAGEPQVTASVDDPSAAVGTLSAALMRIIQMAQRAEDLERATAFYTDLFGFGPSAVYDPPGWFSSTSTGSG